MTTPHDELRERFEKAKSTFEVYSALGLGINYETLLSFLSQEIHRAVEGERERTINIITSADCIARTEAHTLVALINSSQGDEESKN